MELLLDPVVAADGFTCPPLFKYPLKHANFFPQYSGELHSFKTSDNLFLSFSRNPKPKTPNPKPTAHRYERISIAQWFTLGHRTSPKSGAELLSKVLVPNHDLRARVQDWVQARKEGLYLAIPESIIKS